MHAKVRRQTLKRVLSEEDNAVLRVPRDVLEDVKS